MFSLYTLHGLPRKVSRVITTILESLTFQTTQKVIILNLGWIMCLNRSFLRLMGGKKHSE